MTSASSLGYCLVCIVGIGIHGSIFFQIKVKYAKHFKFWEYAIRAIYVWYACFPIHRTDLVCTFTCAHCHVNKDVASIGVSRSQRLIIECHWMIFPALLLYSACKHALQVFLVLFLLTSSENFYYLSWFQCFILIW